MAALPPIGGPSDPLNAPSLSAWAAKVRDTLNDSDVTVDARIAAIPVPAAGAVILSGTATPTAGTGNVGDYYLDTDDRVLYGPKSSSGFGADQSVLGSTPTNVTSSANRSWGLRFQVLTSGQITALRFWRPTESTATNRNMLLWADAGGTALAQVTTPIESGAAGWRTVALATPWPVSAGTFYRVSFSMPASNWYAYSNGTPTSASADLGSPSAYYSAAVDSFPNTANASLFFYADVVFQAGASPWPVALKSVPPGGTTGQFLKKTGMADYAIGWVT